MGEIAVTADGPGKRVHTRKAKCIHTIPKTAAARQKSSLRPGGWTSAYKLAPIFYDPRNGFSNGDMFPYFAQAGHYVEHRLHGA